MELNAICISDCIDYLKTIPDEFVDLIITSPPYNIGIDYDNYKDDLPYPEYLSWCDEWVCECARIMKKPSRIAINHYINGADPKTKRSTFPLFDFRDIFQFNGLVAHKLIVWNDRTRSAKCAWGSWQSASSPYISTPTEGILIGYKGDWKRQMGENTISKEDFMQGVSGVWDDNPVKKSDTRCQYPLSLCRRAIELLSFKGDVVIDPFMGSGTTAIACLQTGRNFMGCDLSEKYVNIANEKLRNLQKQINDEDFSIQSTFSDGQLQAQHDNS